MRAPQIVYLCLIVLAVGRGINKHGEPNENINFWRELLAAAITVGLLYWGGFWTGGAR